MSEITAYLVIGNMTESEKAQRELIKKAMKNTVRDTLYNDEKPGCTMEHIIKNICNPANLKK